MKLRSLCAPLAAALLTCFLVGCPDDSGPALPPAEDVDSGTTGSDGGSVDIAGVDAVPDVAAPDVAQDGGPSEPDVADTFDVTSPDAADSGGPDVQAPSERLVITEIMKDPKAVPDGDGEWFELLNAGDTPVALDGLTIRDEGDDEHVIAGSGVVVKPGELVVLGTSTDSAKNGGVPVAYAYAGVVLANDSDELLVERAGVLLDRVAWSAGWPSVEGSSMTLAPEKLDEAQNDLAASWCPATTAMDDGDRGTPGVANPACAPLTETVCDDGVDDDGDGKTDCDDSDCDGAPVCAPIPPGALVITEIMQNPAAVPDTAGEWIELVNTTAATVDLQGLVLAKSNGTKHTISNDGPLLVAPGGAIVLGASADTLTNGGAPVAYAWSGFSLGNGADDVILRSGDVIVDQVAWDDGVTFPDPTGASMALSPDTLDAEANDAGANWCASSVAFGDGDKGSPGQPNPPCAAPDCGNGELDPGEVCDDGNLTPGDGCEPTCKVTPGGCGDGAQDQGEECDDGNLEAGDGCSPGCEVEEALPPGALIITEIMVNPKAVDDPKGEWFELLNATTGPIDLAGFTIGDGKTDLHVIAPTKPLILGAGKRFVLGTNPDPDTNGGLVLNYAYGNDVTLANNGDTLMISFAKTVVDVVVYTFPEFPGFAGRAMQLAPGSTTAAANDLPASWCPSAVPYGAGDYGTPGAANPECQACGNGFTDDGEACDDGNFDPGDGCEPDCTLTPLPCGNGDLDEGEECDDGNQEPGDGCEPDCTKTPPTCGNGSLDPDEECDDGGTEPLDGCSPDCLVEVAPGDVVITEIMADPAAVADADGEWFEVTSVVDHDIPLGGFVISDAGTDSYTIPVEAGLVLPAGGRLVLGNNADPATNGGVTVDHQLTGVALGNEADSLVLTHAGLVIDQVAWDGGATFPHLEGASMQLDVGAVDAVANDAGANWCPGQVPLPSGDKATPGAENLPCSGMFLCGNGVCDPQQGEDCRSCNGDCGACDGCQAAEGPGCGGCGCEACVCEGDAFCCDVSWDEGCAFDCATTCGVDCTSDGCVPSVVAGCAGCACEEAVCGADSFCCDVAWDASCVDACRGAGMDCGSGDGCSASEQPGCEGCGCEQCVCAQDPYCCETGWDIQCVQRCYECTGACGSDGCAPSELAGCNGCSCEATVCGADPACCEVAWDAACAAACAAAGQDCGSDGCAASTYPDCDGCGCRDAVCDEDPLCCDLAWDQTCVDLCVAAGEDCGSDGCTESVKAGCDGCSCEAEVCAADPACCDVAWDHDCVVACAAAGQDCGTDGCSASALGGCDGCGCEACVCAADPACCDLAWDDACVAACAVDCGQDCGFSCGNGVVEPGEECDTGAALNSDTEPGACRTSCAFAGCGDGVTDPGEGCDDGNQDDLDGCSAGCLVETAPIGPGDLVITEIMQNPAVVSDSLGEWFEVLNTTGAAVDLTGLVIRDDGTDAHTVVGTPQVLLGAGERLVFGANEDMDTNGGVPVGYSYSGVTLDNTSDELELVAGDVVVDRVAWDNGATFPKPSGASMSLDPGSEDALANDVGGNWCLGAVAYGAGDKGTPGAANPACPSCGDGACADGEGCDTCPADCGACSDGCSESPFPGCDGCACESCVCDSDPFCCMNAWDASCVALCAGDCKGCSTCPNGVVEAGEECDDGNVTPGDGCSPTCTVELVEPTAGALVITELLVAPAASSDGLGEWIELTNVGGAPLVLDGLVLADASGAQHTVAPAEPLTVLEGAQVVLGLSADEAFNGGVLVDYVYDGFSLGDEGDTVTLIFKGAVIDVVSYGPTFPLVAGRSLSLDPSLTNAADNDDPSSWCAGNLPFGAGDLGTPGAPNPPCGQAFCGNGVPEGDEACDAGAANSDTEPDACRTTCVAAGCGDGVTDAGEECDDGNDVAGDGCETDCKVTGTQDCGNGIVEAPEECDDGNADETDGCTSGCVRAAVFLGAGQLVITEIMAEPVGHPAPEGAWIEVFNPTEEAIDLRLLTLQDGAGGTHVIAGGPDAIPVPSFGFRVLAAASDFAVVGVYDVADAWGGDLALGAAGGSLIRLLSPAGVVDEVAYGGPTFPSATGGSIELDQASMTAADNDDGALWCPSIQAYGAGDLGSPGAGGHDCAAQSVCGNGALELGEQCDDGNPESGDGCSAECQTESYPQPGPGQVVITEIMHRPLAVGGAQGEWIEVRNVTDGTLDLSGVILRDAAVDSHVLSPAGALLIEAGAELVLGRSANLGGGVAPDYVYTGFQLGNGADSVILEGPGGLIDAVAYDGGVTFPNVEGASMALDPASTDATANDAGAAWCAAKVTFGAGDKGTPGAPNPSCHACGDGTVDPGEACDDGNADPGDGCEPDCTLTPVCGDGKKEGAEECDDGGTEPLDGCSATCTVEVYPAPGPGEVVITELMIDPVALPDAVGEWIEVTNITGGILDLSGVVLRDDGGESVTLSSGKALWIHPGQALVLGRTDDIGGAAPDAVYGTGFSLDDDGDEVILEVDGVLIDRVDYSVALGFAVPQGGALALGSDTTTAFLNDLGVAWCPADQPYGVGDLGTPGATNGLCPYCGDSEVDPGEACDDGNQEPGDGCEPDCTVTPVCGNGLIEPGEQCDDSNQDPGDGCSAACQIELPGHPPAGAVVITEIMADPFAVDDAVGEWFEVTSVGTLTYDLSGVVAHDDGGEVVTLSPAAPLLIEPGGVLLLGRSADLGGGVAPDVVYGAALSFGNAIDSLILEGDQGLIDAVAWDDGVTFPDGPGRSMSLSPDWTDADLNDDGTLWCGGYTAFGAGDFGTPGEANPPCPVCGNGEVEGFEACDDGNDTPTDGCEADCTVTPIVCGNGLLQEGEQCDDGNPDPGDGCDESCFIEVYPPLPGQLVVTEVMRAPAAVDDAHGEWFEVTNTSTLTLDLNGLVFGDDGGELVFVQEAAPIPLPPGETFVFGADGDPATNGGVTVDFTYAGFTLDDVDEVILYGELGVLDRVAWDATYPSAPGASLSLNGELVDADLNDLVEAWCVGITPYGDGDLGTPGAPNPTCAACGDGVPQPPEECDDGPANSDTAPDACRADCTLHRCGDGVIDGAEGCDDGGTVPGDGCAADCQLEVVDVAPGDVIVTELLVLPVAGDAVAGEWFEVTNTTDHTINLHGLVIADGAGNSYTVDAGGLLPLPALGVLVFGRSDDPALDGGAPVDVVYGAVELGDAAGLLTLTLSGVPLDQVAWAEGWPLAAGASLSLSSDAYGAVANDDVASWCLGSGVFGDGDAGTPGLPNALCAGCGNGAVDPGEECDDGDANSDTAADACRSICALPWCGDGVTDTGEACDEGLANSDTAPGACRTTCALAACGDGVLDPADACDDGNLTPGDGCEPDCTIGPVLCGNGALDAYEACDDGNLTPGDGCEPDCTFTNYCGNGALDPGEQCDDGNNEPGDGCNGVCLMEMGPPIPGDLVITEIMKSPGAVSDPAGEWFEVKSTTDRVLLLDGFGLMDDTADLHVIAGPVTVSPYGTLVFGTNGDPGTNGGVAVDYVYPQAELVLDVADVLVIGDGVEEIDRVDWDASWPSTVGSAMSLDPGRSTAILNDKVKSWCDASTLIGGAGPDYGSPGQPNPICTSLLCGNGVPDAGEQCDDGASNSDTEPDACRTDCSSPWCGDGVTDGGEECDDGNGIPSDGCELDCTFTRICGNNIVEPGEECDDGNPFSGDGCSDVCLHEQICGDGAVDAPEECDDGDLNSDVLPGACRMDCKLPWCGDGVLDPGEGCDDGNDIPGDGCEPGCPVVALCGNGIKEGDEECDDGTQNSDQTANACRTDCTLPGCGDGVIDGGEVCDDGNVIDGDGCPSTCAAIAPTAGAVIVNELMIHPNAVVDMDGEWIELRNTTGDWIDLRGTVVTDVQGQTFTIADLLPVLLAPYDVMVMANNGDPGSNGGFFADYVYPAADFGLEDVEDGVTLTYEGQVIDAVLYTAGWPAGSGASMTLMAGGDAASNDVPGSWCSGQSFIGGFPGADLGTPGAPNDACP